MELEVRRYGRYFAVYENEQLLCVTVYRKGARAVIDRLEKGNRKEDRSAEIPIAVSDADQ